MPSYCRVEPRLHIADFARSVAFYRDVLGFTVTGLFPEDAPRFALLENGEVGLQIGGIDADRLPDQRSTCSLYFDVDDVRAIHAALAGKVAIEWGPQEFDYGRRELALRDPDGNLLILSEATDEE